MEERQEVKICTNSNSGYYFRCTQTLHFPTQRLLFFLCYTEIDVPPEKNVFSKNPSMKLPRKPDLCSVTREETPKAEKWTETKNLLSIIPGKRIITFPEAAVKIKLGRARATWDGQINPFKDWIWSSGQGKASKEIRQVRSEWPRRGSMRLLKKGRTSTGSFESFLWFLTVMFQTEQEKLKMKKKIVQTKPQEICYGSKGLEITTQNFPTVSIQLLKALHSGTEVMALNWISARLPSKSSQEQELQRSSCFYFSLIILSE